MRQVLIQRRQTAVADAGIIDEPVTGAEALRNCLASGFDRGFVANISAEPELALHDMAALTVIVTEAGGKFTNLDGRDGPHGPGAIASNGSLHDEIVARLATGD